MRVQEAKCLSCSHFGRVSPAVTTSGFSVVHLWLHVSSDISYLSPGIVSTFDGKGPQIIQSYRDPQSKPVEFGTLSVPGIGQRRRRLGR